MSAPQRNLAAYLDEANAPFRVAEAPIGTAEANEFILKVHAVAINPVDHARQSLGFFIDSFPYIFGCDGAGVVESVGSSVTKLKPGDRVIAMSNEFYCKKTSHAMFQERAVILEDHACKIPDSLEYTSAAVLPLGISTATAMLFEDATLGLRLPYLTREEEKKSEEVLIVWGGSSSVGASDIQLAKAAGYHVVGIARKHNFNIMKDAGAEGVFDHTDDDVVDQVCKFVEGKGWTSVGIADAISTEPTLKSSAEIALRLPGRKFVSTVLPRGIRPEPDMPEGVQASNCKFKLDDG